MTIMIIMRESVLFPAVHAGTGEAYVEAML